MTINHSRNSRQIAERVIIQGDLVLTSPASFGAEDSSSLVDMPLIRDPLEGRALLTGASIAGALRSYLRERELGFQEPGNQNTLESILFGFQIERTVGDSEDAIGEQSNLIVSDVLAGIPVTEVRDCVAINLATRTAESGKKYDFNVLKAGMHFPLRFELLLPSDENKKSQLTKAIAIALQGFERGEISLGARKRRGFGACLIQNWKILWYNLLELEGLINWLTNDDANARAGQSIGQLLKIDSQSLNMDKRSRFEATTECSIEGSLLIRSCSSLAYEPDTIHLHSCRGNIKVPVISGTSLAGALRARAIRICNTIGNLMNVERIISDLFGPKINSRDDTPRASRFLTFETEIKNPIELVQNRIKIDRFTGGAFSGALFNEQPVFGQSGTTVTIHLAIEKPSDMEIGLLLLLMKDLWISDLPLGGASSIGRGRLRGQKTIILYQDTKWSIIQNEKGLKIEGTVEDLERYVKKFVEEVSK